ncbi:MAG: two-component regulator propeller domain-containing protein [Ignavibacteria bacterium]|jgi:ligand-binding sensor domain-containing protein/signal transduction histidine kinase/DNA-binding response OmpR family regulator
MNEKITAKFFIISFNMIYKSLSIFFLLIPLVCLKAQYRNLNFEHITTNDGLSKSSITCILQDEQGFMWIGTFNGLNRYDGYNFTIYLYNQNDPKSITHNFISSIIEDHEGQLWVGTSDGLNRYNRSTDSFQHYRSKEGDSSSISDNQIETIFEDSKQRLWVGTRNGGLNLFDRESETFKRYVYNKENSCGLSSNSVRTIFEDSDGNIWLGHRNGAIDILGKNRETFTQFLYKGTKLTNSVILSFVETRDNNIWIATQGDGLFRLKYKNSQVEKYVHYLHSPGNKLTITGNVILSLMVDKNGKLWIGTEDEGLNIFDVRNNEFYYHKADPLNETGLNNNSIYSIYEDTTGNIWLGTYVGGINMLAGARADFQYYQHLPGNSSSLGFSNVNGFWEDEDQNIWIATGGSGLDLFDRKNKKFIHYNNGNSGIDADVILCLFEDSRGNFWIGTWANGLYKFNRNTKKVIKYTQEENGLGSNNIFQIVEDKNGDLWLCTFWGGLTYFNPRKQSTVVYNSGNSGLKDNDTRTIAKDYQGNLWIGTDVGLDFFNPVTKEFKAYQHNENNKSSISKGFVTYILEAKDSTLWIGTTGGLNKLDRKTDSFEHYNMQKGLANDEIMCIIEDNSGILWVSTGKGISGFDPANEEFMNYDVSDGLQGNEFNTRSGCKTKNGEIVLGGSNGFNIFQPEDLKKNPFIPPVIIDDLKIFNRPVVIGGEDSPLQKNISETKKIVFTYKQSVFSFGFVALNYILPEKNQYAYMMEGFDADWNYIGSNRTATYTNLDAGSYTFRVKASNNDGIWNEEGASLSIVIEPPFWKTWWAYLIESFLIIMIIYFIANYYISRQRLRNALKMEHLELEKMYELDQMKTQFFSNISHEFQSPMTLILSPLEKIIKSFSGDKKIKNSLMLVYRNAKRLKRMTNQLKDLNKLETGDLRLSLSKGDIIHFVEEIFNSFKDYAKDHKIDFKFEQSLEEHVAWFDADKVDKIIYNLLSNAFKFTNDNGKICVKISIHNSETDLDFQGDQRTPSQYVEIKVQDNGIGISEDKMQHIFKRYYHLEDYKGHYYEGSGVGLAFVYELVNLYKGEITVDSVEEQGTTFTVRIPIDEHYLEENQLVGKFKISSRSHYSSFKYNQAPVPGNGTEGKKDKSKSNDIPVVLIVEDDKEIRDYIKEYFDENYRIIEAEYGKLGCKKALQVIPDLIITDIRMESENDDGILLCKKLKNDEKTSHIPIIMLTGYTSQEYQIRGLAQGADVYLTKPFNIDVLEAHMTNLLDSRKKLQEKFSKEFILGPGKVPVTDIDEKFLKRLTKAVEEHMSDDKFNADVLSEEIGMSRMQLYRKLRGLTNQTVHEFIRNIRLKRAVQLLEQKRMTITEVAYEVGFNDLTYFARCFRKQFDKSPSEYVSSKS